VKKEESVYWDEHFINKGSKIGQVHDNLLKRCEIVRRVLRQQPIGVRVLEIGCGQGLVAAAVNLVTMGNISYIGTDVSEVACHFVKKRWKLEAKHADILNLPHGPFNMVWAFDTLEHVHPNDRMDGYQQICQVLAPENAMICLNVPLNESQHNPQFDHPFGEQDVFNLNNVCCTQIQTWEPYTIESQGLSFLWVELVR
jgi:SAM-dependent methyltransferase